MRLDTCLLADAATGTPDGKLFIHGGGISRLTPPTLPWTHPMLALVLRFELASDDADRTHEIEVALVSPQGDQMLSPSPKIEVPRQHLNAVEGEELYLQAALQLGGITFASEGIYSMDVRLDGKKVRSLRLAVVAREAPQLPHAPNRAERRAKKPRSS